MKKSTKELALGVAAVAGATAIGTTAVHADTNAPVASSADTSVTSATTDSIADAQKSVDAKTENLSAAKTNADTASKAVTSAKSDVAAASDAVVNDQKDVTAKTAAASSANALSDKATADNIYAASDTLDKDNKALASAKTANDSAQKDAKSADADAKTADAVYTKGQQAVKDAQAVQSAAQKALDDAQTANKNIAEKSAAASAADAAYNKALTADQNAKIKADQANQAMNDAIGKSASAKKDLDAANADFAAKQKAQQEAQTALTNAQDHALDPTEELARNGITVTATDAAKAVAQKLNNGTKFNQLSKDEQQTILSGVHFNYSPTGPDRITKLGKTGDTFNLASLYRQLNDTEAELVNQFVAMELDGARHALGLHTGQVLVNPALQALSQSMYKIGEGQGTVKTALDAAGLDDKQTATVSLGNEKIKPMGQIAVKADLNNAINDALNNVFSNESNYDSNVLASLLGLNTAGTTDPTYIGYMPDEFNHDNVLAVANANNIQDQRTINEGNSYPNIIRSQSANIDKLNAAATKANQELAASQKTQASAQKAYTDAQSAQAQALKANDEAKSAKEATAKTLANAKTAKDAADKALTEAQKTASDPAKIADSQAKLTKAQQAVKDAQVKLDELSTAQKTAQAKLVKANEAATKAQKAVKDAQAKVDQDTTNLNALKNAPQTAKDAAQALKDAQDKLVKDQDTLKTAQAKLGHANDDLAAANKLVKDDQAALDQATSHYQALQAIQSAKSEQQVQDKDYHIAGQHVVDGNGQIVPGWTYMGEQLVDPYGNVVPAGADPMANTVVTSTTTTPTNDSSAQTLPQTGDGSKAEVAAAGLGLSTLAAMFGFTGSKKREYQN